MPAYGSTVVNLEGKVPWLGLLCDYSVTKEKYS